MYTDLEPLFLSWLRNLNIDDIETEATDWQHQVREHLFRIADEKVRGAGQKALIGRVIDAGEDGEGRVISAGSLYRSLQYRIGEDLPLLREHEREQRKLHQRGDQA